MASHAEDDRDDGDETSEDQAQNDSDDDGSYGVMDSAVAQKVGERDGDPKPQGNNIKRPLHSLFRPVLVLHLQHNLSAFV